MKATGGTNEIHRGYQWNPQGVLMKSTAGPDELHRG